MKLNSDYEPVFIISNLIVEKSIDPLKNAAIGFVKINKYAAGQLKKRPRNKVIFSFYNFLKSTGLKLILDYVKTDKILKTHYRQALEIIQEYKPAAVFLTGDRHLGFELPLIKAAKVNGIKTIIVPVSYSDPEASSKIRKETSEYRIGKIFPIVNRIFFSRKEMKKQIYNSTSGKFVFYNAGVTMALYKNNMLPVNPWIMGGGNSDMIIADGKETKEKYEKLGVPGEKIMITGHQSYDILYQNLINKDNLKKKIYEEYSFDFNKKLIILGVPQLAEHGFLSWPEHWKEIDFLISTLSGLKENLLLSLHPKSDLSRYKFLEKKYNCAISKNPLADILAIADCYIATFSSTVRWAVLCAIPTIVVDFYNFNYDVFDKYKGVKKVNQKDLLEPIAKKILADESYHKSIQKEQKEAAEKIAPFDGKSRQRILEIVDKICIQS